MMNRFKNNKDFKFLKIIYLIYGDETSLNDSKYIGGKNSKGYRFFNSKAKITIKKFTVKTVNEVKYE